MTPSFLLRTRDLVSCALALFVFTSIPRSADAQLLTKVCSPRPVKLDVPPPGTSLVGGPSWADHDSLGRQTRPELNEPRWAASQQQTFASDATFSVGRYRIIYDDSHSNPAYRELVVSFQVPSDSSIDGNDKIYFGFTTDGTAGQQAEAVVITAAHAPGGPPDPVPVDPDSMQHLKYTTPGAPDNWSVRPATRPSWLKEAYLWRNNDYGDAAWGINFKVKLTAAPLSPAGTYRFMLGIHKQLTNTSHTRVTTPSLPIGASFYGTTLFISDPSKWAEAEPIQTGCPGGITISNAHVGTINNYGDRAKINYRAGQTNTFYADTTVPPELLPQLDANFFKASFRVSNWGTAYDPAGSFPLYGEWNNGTGGVARVEGSCVPNASGQVCGHPTPDVTLPHQCMLVSLQKTLGQQVPISVGAAYLCMRFRAWNDEDYPPPSPAPIALSASAPAAPVARVSQAVTTTAAPAKPPAPPPSSRTLDDFAEISVKGLGKAFNDRAERKLYVFESRQLPKHGNTPIPYSLKAMLDTYSFAENSSARRERAKPPRVPRDESAAYKPPTPSIRSVPLPNTGIGDLDLLPEQALAATWPTYQVQVYYDSGKTLTLEDGKQTRELVPLHPFTYHLVHDGPVYGFTHKTKVADRESLRKRLGADTLNQGVREVRSSIGKDVLALTVPDDGTAYLETIITAHEVPEEAPKDCPPVVPPAVPPPKACGCRVPGEPRSHGGAWIIAALGLGAWAARRRRSARFTFGAVRSSGAGALR